MVKIIISRFKCYSEKVEFTFDDDNLTLLKAPSNVGKSTIFEAVYWCFYGNNKKMGPKGKQPSVKNPTMVTVVLDNGTQIKRIKPPDTVEVSNFGKGDKVLTDESAQYWIDENFGSKGCFLATSYIRQSRESPLIELKNSDRIQLLQELTFGKSLEEDDTNNPKHYSSKVDENIKVVKSKLLVLEGKISGLEECFTTSTSACKTYNKIWKEEMKLTSVSATDNSNIKDVIKQLKEEAVTKEEEINTRKKELAKLRKKWTEYTTSIAEGKRLEEEVASLTKRASKLIYNNTDLQKQIEWLELKVKRTSQEEQLQELVIDDSDIVFLERNKNLASIAKEIVLYKEHIKQVKSLNYNADNTQIASLIEEEIKSGNERLAQCDKEDIAKQNQELLLEAYTRQKKERATWETSVAKIKDNIAKAEESKQKYENFFNDNSVSELIAIAKIAEEGKTNKAILSKFYTVKTSFGSLIDVLKEKIRDIDLLSKALVCPSCTAHLTLSDGQLVQQTKIENADTIQKSCKNGIETIRNIEELLKDYQNKKKLPTELDDEEPAIPIKPVFDNIDCSMTSNERKELTKRIRLLQSFHIPELKVLPSLLELHILKEVENFLTKDKVYSERKKIVALLDKLQLDEEPLSGIDKKTCQKAITENNVCKSQLEEAINNLKKHEDLPEPDTKVESLEKQITNIEARIKKIQTLIEAGKRILELEKLAATLEESKVEIKSLIDRHIALERIKQIIVDTRSQALEETVSTINSILTEISKVMYDSETRITLSMFKELKTRDHLKAELTIQLVRGFDEDAIIYDVDDLCGGEKSRLTLALTLALSTIGNTPFFFIDEGMSSMHSRLREICIKLIREYTTNKTVVNVCHTIHEGGHDNVLVLKEEEDI